MTWIERVTTRRAPASGRRRESEIELGREEETGGVMEIGGKSRST